MVHTCYGNVGEVRPLFCRHDLNRRLIKERILEIYAFNRHFSFLLLSGVFFQLRGHLNKLFYYRINNLLNEADDCKKFFLFMCKKYHQLEWIMYYKSWLENYINSIRCGLNHTLFRVFNYVTHFIFIFYKIVIRTWIDEIYRF